MSIAIERLNESARPALSLHFLALPAADRYLRFAAAVTPPVIARYVEGIDFNRDAVFAVHPAPIGDGSRETLAGVVHAAFPDDGVELGISVLPAYRGHGLASALAEQTIEYARSRGTRWLSMHVLRQNAPMLRIARKLGMTIVDRGADLFAHVELICRNRSSPRQAQVGSAAVPILRGAVSVQVNEPFTPGTHVVTDRALYAHHGIYVGNGRVVHYAGLYHGWQSGPVEEVSLEQFAHGQRVFSFAQSSRPFSNAEIVARARSRLGENMYDILRNNCEHFCEWCVTGRKRSRQVHKWMSLPSRLLRTAFRWGVDALEVVAPAARVGFYRPADWNFARASGSTPVGPRWQADDVEANDRRFVVQLRERQVPVRVAALPAYVLNRRDRPYHPREAVQVCYR